MKGLIIKDIINMRKYGRSVVFVMVFYVFFAIMMNSTAFISGMIVLLFSMTVITSFSYDKQAGWDEYALSLPLPRKTIVKSKYMLSLLLTLSGAILSVLLGAVLGLFLETGGIMEQLIISYVLFGTGILFLSILLPLIFKFGAEKSRILLLIVFAAPAAAILIIGQQGIALPDEALAGRLLAYLPIMLAALFAFSYMLSRYFFENKEM
jgi:ABC-2 type transport system permease protein